MITTSTSFRKFKAKVFRAALLLVLAAFTAQGAMAQSLLCESFDGTTFPPTGWTSTTGSSGINWSRVTAGTFPAQSPHSGAGEAKFASFSYSSGSAELRTPAISFTAAGTKQVTFWMYRDNGYLSTPDNLAVYVNTTATSTGGTLLGTVNRAINLAPVVSANGWYQYTFNVPASFNTATNYIIFVGTSFYGNDIYLDDVCVINLVPCSSTPTAGTISPSGLQSGCAGTSYPLSATGTTVAGNLSYTWMQSTNGGTTWVTASGTGQGTPNFSTAPLAQTTLYHLVVACTTTGQKDSTGNVSYTITPPAYASIPYTQDFENWINGCGTTDLPSNNWTNQPYTSDASWRRDDQGASANWQYPTSGAYTPVSVVGAHSARYHAYYAPTGSTGTMSLYIDCSTFTGPKELQLYYVTYNSTFSSDSINVYLSTNGGATFNTAPIMALGPNNGQWQFMNALFTSNSAQTVLKFVGKGNMYYGDLGLDYVRVLPPCTGKPTAGVVNPVTPCAGTNFTLSLTGTSQAAGLTYQWQYLTTTNTWQNINPGNTAMITYNISTPTSVRAIVTCSNSTQADTTAPYLVNLASFYYCYCGSSSQYNYNGYSANIGNLTITTQPANVTILNNGTAAPITNNANAFNAYTDYRYTVAPMCLYRDSLYKMFVTENGSSSFYASTVVAFIDYNRDGTFQTTGTPSERIFTKNTSTVGNNPVSDTFRIPHTAQIGTTGLRAIIVMGTGATVNPCGTYYYGETEDYLVNICYPPCNGPSNAGTAVATDTVICPGYTIDLADTTHEMLRSGLLWSWQSSTDNGATWTHVTGSNGKDTLNNVVINGPIQYRFRIRCTLSNDTTYSNVINITNGQNFQCYGMSQALGNRSQDSSDIGTFSIGNYIMPVGYSAGPHVKNPLAIRHRTDYTQQPNWMILNADSTYPVAIYHTMRSDNHGDARVSVFIDYNNDLQYNANGSNYPYGPERVFTGLSTANNWYVSGTVTIPNAVIPETPTGLRVVLNNDVNPNATANLGQGNYVSGETEDYVVLFHRPSPTRVGSTGLVKDVIMYPNPTDGRFTLGVNSAKDIALMDVVVTNITGQTILSRSYSHTGTQFTTSLDLSSQAAGVYFVELRADGDRITRKLVIR